MKIEVVYCAPEKQMSIDIDVPEFSTVHQAILYSNILAHCPDINLDRQKVGIYSVIVNLEQLLKDNDRVEIYRPLPVDPMTQRFERVKKERKKHAKK